MTTITKKLILSKQFNHESHEHFSHFLFIKYITSGFYVQYIYLNIVLYMYKMLVVLEKVTGMKLIYCVKRLCSFLQALSVNLLNPSDFIDHVVPVCNSCKF